MDFEFFVSDHYSYISNEGISNLFKIMFLDSEIVATFSCGSNKTAYITNFSLAPFNIKELTEQVTEAAGFVAKLDESLNKASSHRYCYVMLF